MKITIFGSASPIPGQPAYEDAYLLGRLLAAQGHAIITGGYMGTMEAASKGASDAGGHVIGVTCEEIEKWRPIRPNPWIDEEWRQATLQTRLLTLIDSCDAALALPGGPGTLAEVSMMWNRLIIAAIQPKPLILLGPGWRQVIEAFVINMQGCIRDKDLSWLHYSENIQEAVKELSKNNTI